jgi:topoisomerase-4 subunit A
MAKEKYEGTPIGENETGVQGQYKNWFLDYASYVILERAVPAIEDGLNRCSAASSCDEGNG